MSMAGSALLLAYFVWGKNDSVGVMSNVFPMAVAAYNFAMHRRPRQGREVVLEARRHTRLALLVPLLARRHRALGRNRNDCRRHFLRDADKGGVQLGDRGRCARKARGADRCIGLGEAEGRQVKTRREHESAGEGDTDGAKKLEA